jgi:3'-phosphoadenosine 5'-phosphosulfate sulfotransferase (PAPS reductase)/FAD synthetase
MNTNEIKDLIKRNALFVVNHSGGKDSQAMMIKIRELVPHDQIVVIHAELPEVEWEGTLEHAEKSAGNLPFLTCRSGKTFFDMVEHRQMFPSPQYRQCTSDLKRAPIEKAIRHYLKDNPQYNGLIVNCMGLRAEESSSRSKATVFKLNARNSKAGREWYDWLPIHDMLIGEVFDTIHGAGEEAHWAYAAGMSRLSCCFCIMSSRDDLITAAKLNPELYARVVETENRIGHTMTMPRKGEEPRTLEEITGIKITIE